MKNATSAVLLIPVIFWCIISLTFSAASASVAVYTAVPVQNESNGILTLENGDKWYKVRHFEDDAEYILTVKTDAGRQMILAVSDQAGLHYNWQYYRSYMTTSTAPRYSTLTCYGYRLSHNGTQLAFYDSGSESGDKTWDHDGPALRYYIGGTSLYLKYDAERDEPFCFTEDPSEASEVIIYSRRETLEHCIKKQPSAESYVLEGSGYPAPVFSAGLDADVTADSVEWFVDGMAQGCTDLNFTAETLTDRPAGVHRVYCMITAHDSSGVYYSERSADATFVIAKGVVPDSFITFSDIHEEYGFIGNAIEAVMEETDGLIPALIICTGDLVYGPTMDKERESSRYLPQITAQLGGLDAVFVAGNHDSAEAVSLMSAAAGLGAAPDLPAKGGVIFSSESEDAVRNGKSSRYAKGIITYGINYDAAIQETGNSVLYTYENVIEDIDDFLRTTAADYHGQLIVISAHSGLHVVGLQTDSPDSYPIQSYYGWLGENAYNIDLSYELAQTINQYAEQYDMDIMFLFGHNHSRNERELFLTDGGTLLCPIQYAYRTADPLTIRFTYAHSGYLSTVIGCADARFSFVYRVGSGYSYDLISLREGVVRHTEIPAKHPYEEPVPVETTAAAAETTGMTTISETSESTATVTTVQTSATARTSDTSATSTAVQTAALQSALKESAAPNTGEKLNFIVIGIPAFILLMLSRKQSKEHDLRPKE